MFVYMKGDATAVQIERVQAEVTAAGFAKAIVSPGAEVVVVNCIGTLEVTRKLALVEFLEQLPGVIRAELARTPFRLTSKQSRPGGFTVPLNGCKVGDGQPICVIAGPCAVESEEQILAVARHVKKHGAIALRGGAYKPRTSPHSPQGLEEEGLRLLALAREETGLPIVTEVISPELVSVVAEVADVLQVGARNMQNYALLKALGSVGKPVLLKRGMAATVDEWLQAAEYVVAAGNPEVILCARGIRGINGGYTRFNTDIDAIPVAKRLTSHPVIDDPSHASGDRGIVIPMALAAVAAGADGLIVEVHPDPDQAMSDGPQSLTLDQFVELMGLVRGVAAAVGRSV